MCSIVPWYFLRTELSIGSDRFSVERNQVSGNYGTSTAFTGPDGVSVHHFHTNRCNWCQTIAGTTFYTNLHHPWSERKCDVGAGVRLKALAMASRGQWRRVRLPDNTEIEVRRAGPLVGS